MINTGQLAHTFIKLSDNLTMTDIYSFTSQTPRKPYSPFGKHAEQAKLCQQYQLHNVLIISENVNIT